MTKMEMMKKRLFESEKSNNWDADYLEFAYKVEEELGLDLRIRTELFPLMKEVYNMKH